MGNEDNEYFDKDLQELNKLIQSANDLVGKLGETGNNPFDILKQQINTLPHQQEIQNPKNNQTILHCINKSTNPIPRFEKEGDSGFDLRANLEKPILIKPMTMETIPTGLFFEVENGYEVQIRSRSGLAKNKQLFVLNSLGTLDSGYRNEVIILLFNLGSTEIQVNHGDRIAQGVVCPVMGSGKLTIIETDKLTESQRGNDGFGSTGIN